MNNQPKVSKIGNWQSLNRTAEEENRNGKEKKRISRQKKGKKDGNEDKRTYIVFEIQQYLGPFVDELDWIIDPGLLM